MLKRALNSERTSSLVEHSWYLYFHSSNYRCHQRYQSCSDLLFKQKIDCKFSGLKSDNVASALRFLNYCLNITWQKVTTYIHSHQWAKCRVLLLLLWRFGPFSDHGLRKLLPLPRLQLRFRDKSKSYCLLMKVVHIITSAFQSANTLWITLTTQQLSY
jgi:hypothetical protein